jgi:serine/threonine protein kinase
MAPGQKCPSKIKGGEFEATKRLGAGCFGEVYRGKKLDGSDVAIKFETKQGKSAPQLEHEMEVLSNLRAGYETIQGIVECFFYGVENQHNCMVMELLGKSLEDRMVECKNRMTVKSVVLIAEQVLQRIEFLHCKGLVHRDIKPENFMFGIKNKCHHVYIIDFGLSKKYWDDSKNQHCNIRQKLSLTGTARYASINAHKGVEQSRRDDLEAIGHMFLYFLRGALPWSGLDAKTQEEKYRKICMKKEQTDLGELCKGFPDGFRDYLQTARTLEFEKMPDYEKLFDMIHTARPANAKDHEYEWFDNKVIKRENIPKKEDGTEDPKKIFGEHYIIPEELVPLNPKQRFPQPDDKDNKKKKGGGKGDGGTKCHCVIC